MKVSVSGKPLCSHDHCFKLAVWKGGIRQTITGKEEPLYVCSAQAAGVPELEPVLPIVVLMEDAIIHTPRQPRCNDITCPCHEEEQLVTL